MVSRSVFLRRATSALLSPALWSLCLGSFYPSSAIAETHAEAGPAVPAHSRASSGASSATSATSASRSDAEARALADRIANRYGQEKFQKAESIRFTVRETRDREETVRHWTWFPKIDSVYFQGPDPKGMELQAGYSRENKWSLSSETIAGIDRLFARDRLNLLFPVLFSKDRVPALRIKEGGWLEITYPMEDAEAAQIYEVLADTDGAIRAWKAPGSVTGSAGTRIEWSPPKLVDGLPLSLERTGPKGRKIRFTEVKIAGITRRK